MPTKKDAPAGAAAQLDRKMALDAYRKAMAGEELTERERAIVKRYEKVRRPLSMEESGRLLEAAMAATAIQNASAPGRPVHRRCVYWLQAERDRVGDADIV